MPSIACPRCRKFYHPSEFPGNGVCIHCYATQVGNEGLSTQDLYIKYQTSRFARWKDNQARRGIEGPLSRNFEQRLERARERGVDMLGRAARRSADTPQRQLELTKGVTAMCEACLEEKEDVDSYMLRGVLQVLCGACAPKGD